MIITNSYKFFANSLLDPSDEYELSEKEFIDLINLFRNNLQPEWGVTYKKYWILDQGKKTENYFVKRLDGIEYNEE